MGMSQNSFDNQPIQYTAYTPFLPNSVFTIEGCVDFREWRTLLERVNEIFILGGIEKDYVSAWLEDFRKEAKAKRIDPQTIIRQQEQASRALRCTFLRVMLGTDYRDLSVRLADSELLRWFMGMSEIKDQPTPSKSTLERYEKQIAEVKVRELCQKLLVLATQQPQEGERQALELAQAERIENYFLDVTCIQGMIHFPVDWVMLRDATRTLTKAMILIREEGIKHRMPAPEEFMKQMNRYSIAMTHQGRRKDSKKKRKVVFRSMKRLVKIVSKHAKVHRDLLESRWEESTWTWGVTQQVLKRIDTVLEQLPQAIAQAHDRIIRGRLVENDRKILSLYEPDMNVIVRGKAGAMVEFGNSLRLGETESGLIVDWKLYKDQAPSDQAIALEGVKETQKHFKIKNLVMDRGGDSKNNEKQLKVLGVQNGICPKDPQKLSEKMKDPEFRQWQTRRAQTEARISIFKNCFLGRPFRSKGFEHRELLVTWGVFVHNLWVIARKEKAPAKVLEKPSLQQAA